MILGSSCDLQVVLRALGIGAVTKPAFFGGVLLSHA